MFELPNLFGLSKTGLKHAKVGRILLLKHGQTSVAKYIRKSGAIKPVESVGFQGVLPCKSDGKSPGK
jgi:hypothetical protein